MSNGSDYGRDIGDVREWAARLDERSEHLATKVYVNECVGEVGNRVTAIETTIKNWKWIVGIIIGLSSVMATAFYLLIRLTVSGTL